MTPLLISRYSFAPWLGIFAGIFLSSNLALAADKKEAAKPSEVVAEAPKEEKSLFTCKQEIFYSWKRIPKALKEESDAPKKGKPTVAPTPDPAIYSPIKVNSAVIAETGASEAEVQAKLSAQLLLSLDQAADLCRRSHEVQGDCGAGKFGSLSSQLTRVDFETRRALAERILSDCEKSSGICLGTEAGEVVCHEEKIAAPEVTPPPAATKDAKKK